MPVLLLNWLLHADPRVAPLWRSRRGSITPIIRWLLHADHDLAPICRSVTQELGFAANATERAVRGECRTPKKDGIYRAALRGESTRQMQQARDVRERSADALRRFDRGRETLQRTRAAVVTGWRATARQLEAAGAYELADGVDRFVERMPPPMPDQVQLVRQSRSRSSSQRIDPMERTR